jgi:ATP-dependent Clp protease ATP-binding subunit ClpC
LNILNKIKGAYEDYHKVTYSEEAINACVKLADRYITDREFPDKAIDILDEVGSRSQVIIKAPKKISDLEKNIADIKEEKNKVVKSQKYEEAAKLRDTEKQAIEKLEAEKNQWLSDLDTNRVLITDEDVSVVVATMTGIPLDRLTEKEGARLMNMEAEIGDSVIGQYEAVEKISKSLRRNRVGIRNPKKPLGTFLFLGPTGTGKCFTSDTQIVIRDKKTDLIEKIDINELKNRINH